MYGQVRNEEKRLVEVGYENVGGKNRLFNFFGKNFFILNFYR